MQYQKETKILAISLILTVGIVIFGYKSGHNLANLMVDNPQSSFPNHKEERISLGETILVKNDINNGKKAGVEAFSNGDFAPAITQLEESIQINRNDPETLIYLNNAKALSIGKTWKIAVSVPISSNLNVAQEILRGVAQAQDELNRTGGINGRRLVVAIANDDNNPEIAKNIAVEFVKDTDILAVVGHNSSDVSAAAAQIYQDKLVMISPTSFAKSLSEIASQASRGNYIFRTVPSVDFVANTLSDYIIKTARKSKVAICSDSQAIDNMSFSNEVTTAIYSDGGKLLNISCDFSGRIFNPRAIIYRAIKAGADSLILAPHVDRINKAIEVVQANEGQLALFGSPTLYTSQTLESGQANVNQMVLAVPWHPAANSRNYFTTNATNLWGGQVNWRTATAYDATQVIITGLKEVNISRTRLQKLLSNPEFTADGATGKIEFLPTGDRNGAAILIKVQPSSESLTGYEFVPLSQSGL